MELPRVDLESLRDLMKLMDQFKFDEIELRDEGRRLHLLRNHPGVQPQVVMPTMMAGGGMAPAAAAGAGAEAASPNEPGPGIKVIKSPMVGTFYRTPSPDAAPFVEEGQSVTDNTVLCIIEAMKVMNEIKADCAGELVKILVANGEAVEYGEPLFHVKVG